MSDFDVYEGEMTNRFSDQDIERFFSGQTPENEVLARLAVHLGAWHAVYERDPSEEEVTTFAAEAAEIAASITPTATPQAVTGAAVSPFMRLRSALRRKLATGLAAVLLLAGTTGVAVAADTASPDDTLYGLDKALEAVGILDGGVAERLEEARTLNESSNSADALAHAAEAIEQANAEANVDENALAGLDEAIAALGEISDGSDQAMTVRTNVAAMLQWMSDNATLLDDPNTEPGAFGQGVADLARQISGDIDAADNAADEAEAAEENAEDAGPPEDIPAGPPADVPGRP